MSPGPLIDARERDQRAFTLDDHPRHICRSALEEQCTIGEVAAGSRLPGAWSSPKYEPTQYERDGTRNRNDAVDPFARFVP
jgi:hypothetical protein